MALPEIGPVAAYLLALQDRICAELERADGEARFREDRFERERGGLSRVRVLAEGALLEKAAVNFSHTVGQRLPAAASARRPELAGGAYEAVSVSSIVHPRSPFVPTAHLNVRWFAAAAPRGASAPDGASACWFGGGFDLTPCYVFEEDAVHWHRTAQAACAPFGPDVYPRFKKQCDEYFFLRHRGETRGIGGLFFDDIDDWGFERGFALIRSVGDHFLPAYLPIVERRRALVWGEREREFQLWRRGRYVEFNLLHDRGTRFGLEAGARAESILVSLPPLVRWRYGFTPEPGSREAELEGYLRPRDWLGG